MKTQKLMLFIGLGIIFLATQFNASGMKTGEHPAYLHALSDLRAARWMIEHRPGNWQTTQEEETAVKEIDAAINEIKKASIDDGKDINDHPKVDEHPDHAGRLHDAIDFLKKAREDVNKEEDNSFAHGLQDRAIRHIDEAIKFTEKAIGMKPTEHPNYLQALSDLRAARWMIEHRPGDWQKTQDEEAAVKEIDAAINEIKTASIDDGKDINDHPKVDEHPDHKGRLHDAMDFLKKAHEDVNKEEDNTSTQGLKDRALRHIDEAVKFTEKAIHA